MKRNAILAAIVLTSATSLTAQAQSGGDKVALPDNPGVLYNTLDRSDNKQFRELYVSPRSALDAARRDQPLPSGTVLTMIQYAAKLDAEKNPEKDANGRFIKTNVVGYTVMEKRTGWGAEYPADIRNGEWEYQAFTADRKPNQKAVLANCFKCHKPLDARQDFVFSYDQLKSHRP